MEKFPFSQKRPERIRDFLFLPSRISAIRLIEVRGPGVMIPESVTPKILPPTDDHGPSNH
jgi:hypothetical protein